MKSDLLHKNVGVLGYGVNNAGLVEYLQNHGARVTICDKNESLQHTHDGVEYRLGDTYLNNLTDFDIIFRTPGLPYLTPQIQDAKQAGVTVSSQTQLFMELCQAPIIGVTGTKGKGTTATLIEAILNKAAEVGELPGKVYLAGNIGLSPLTFVDEVKPEDWVILELSSFQLQDLSISPHIAVVLNVTSDHLDHHKTVGEYVEAKKNIVQHQSPADYAVLNFDSPTSRGFNEATSAKKYFFSTSTPVTQGACIEGGFLVLRLTADQEEKVCAVGDIALVGKHNLENVTAGAAAAVLAGAAAETIGEGIKHFSGLDHRLQFVHEVHGVKYYDDSKATTPDSTIAAVQAFEVPTTLIIGGSSKGADFTELIEAITRSCVNHIICIGQEGERIKELLHKAKAPQKIIDGATTMKEIVTQAARVTHPGGVVLLSPAAASFDMFKNAEDRGEQFQEAVIQL